MIKILVALVAFLAAGVSAQHHSPMPGAHSQAPASSYAGEEAREIKSLSAQEQRAWLEGEGMGLAKAAELNRYPGPMHVLEHAEKLRLSASQQEKTRELMRTHKLEARTLGAALVEAERRLDDMFRSGRAAPAEVDRLTQQIGELQARIRASHLNTHLAQTSLLLPEQVAAYQRLRGYAR